MVAVQVHLAGSIISAFVFPGLVRCGVVDIGGER